MRNSAANPVRRTVAVFLVVGSFAVLSLNCSKSSRGGGAKFVDGGSVSAENLKTPLQASVQVQQRRGTVQFSLKLTDAEGRQIQSLRTPRGRPAPPKLRILDDQGKRVYSCTLEYG